MIITRTGSRANTCIPNEKSRAKSNLICNTTKVISPTKIIIGELGNDIYKEILNIFLNLYLSHQI